MGTKYKSRTINTTDSNSTTFDERTCLRCRSYLREFLNLIFEFFSDYLKLQPNEHIDSLPHVLFRKYIAYAQKYIKPEIQTDAKLVLEEFYLQLRRQYKNDNYTPVTTRQLYSLLRLTQV